MSVQGKNSLSYKKKNTDNQNQPHTGFKTLVFGHQFASAGETIIPFDGLVQPSDWAQAGLVNPIAPTLLAAQLQVFKKNITVTSSARGIIQKSEYTVHSNRIEFLNIESLVNEVFEVEVADLMITGNLIVDQQTIRVPGEMNNGETDFNMGYEFDIFNEEIIVFRDGIQMFRADNNDSSGATGNYYYLDNGNGRGSVLRFFEAAVGVEPILVVTTGGVVDPANVSTFQQIESLQGQLDAVIPTVAALAGVPETNFRVGPNNVDLKAFGDKVLALEKIFDVEIPIITEWSAWEPISLNAVTTVPTKGTTVVDRVRWRQVGEDYEVEYEFQQNSAGTPGNGEYVLQLPSGLEFASDQIFVTNPLNNVEDGEDQAALVGYGHLGTGGGARGPCSCFASSASNFRIGIIYTFSSYSAWSSTYISFANVELGFNFKLKFKGKNLTATQKISDLI